MKKKSSLYPMALCFLVLFLYATPSHASTYYVDKNHPSASDDNAGTLNSPWMTIQHASEMVAAGDTVFVRAGTYFENIYLDQGGNETDGHIVFAAYPGETPVIDGEGVTESGNGVILAAPRIKMLGFEIRNWEENGIWIEEAPYFEVSDCEVHDVTYGIGVSEGTHDFAFNRVVVHHFTLYGFDVTSSEGTYCYNGVFNDCLAHTGRDPGQNVDGFALGHGDQYGFVFNRCITYGVFDGFDISSRNTILNRCLAYDCGNGAYKLWQDNIKLINCIGYQCESAVVELDWDDEPGKVELSNCTFFQGETFLVWVENNNDALDMYNCILAGGSNIGLAFEEMGTANYRGDYNLFQNENPSRAVAVAYTDEFSLDDVAAGIWTTYSGQDSHSLVAGSAAGLFMDPNQPDLHLQSSSPAIDKGDNNHAPNEDYDGNPRPVGAKVDIGAFEFDEATVVLQHNCKSLAEGQIFTQNYPNPFKTVTTIYCEVPSQGLRSKKAELCIFNLEGRLIRTLAVKDKTDGRYTYIWDRSDQEGNKVVDGIYLYSIRAGEYLGGGKMILSGN
jgi:hypothetical protein